MKRVAHGEPDTTCSTVVCPSLLPAVGKGFFMHCHSWPVVVVHPRDCVPHWTTPMGIPRELPCSGYCPPHVSGIPCEVARPNTCAVTADAIGGGLTWTKADVPMRIKSGVTAGWRKVAPMEDADPTRKIIR
jgi:hypothetical protein